MRTVHFVHPKGIDDPAKPSGGNVYDRRLIAGLTALGWDVRTAGEPPDDALVLVDGLVLPSITSELARRVRLVALMHMVQESALLTEAAAVVTTSEWTRRRLLDLYDLHADRVHAAPPGVDDAPLAPTSEAGTRLLCVGVVARHKGTDVLIEALDRIDALPWTCTWVGALDEVGLPPSRIDWKGPRAGEAVYADADLLVLPSRGESYGMVVTEALARGIPVIATAVGGVPEALGRAPDGSLPGILVPPEDPAALAAALRRWLVEPGLRQQLKARARGRRTTLTGWEVTSKVIAGVLSGIVMNVSVSR